MYRNVQQSSESQSEASSSAESDWSDINSIALQMGLHPKDLCVERFKVDRQKLENMIKSEIYKLLCLNVIIYGGINIFAGSSSTDGMNSAEFFFDNVSNPIFHLT